MNKAQDADCADAIEKAQESTEELLSKPSNDLAEKMLAQVSFENSS